MPKRVKPKRGKSVRDWDPFTEFAKNLVLMRPSYFEGVQRVYRWGSGGVSLIDGASDHGAPWEAAVVRFKGKDNTDFMLTYETPLTNDVERFYSVKDVGEFLSKAAEFFESESKSES